MQIRYFYKRLNKKPCAGMGMMPPPSILRMGRETGSPISPYSTIYSCWASVSTIMAGNLPPIHKKWRGIRHYHFPPHQLIASHKMADSHTCSLSICQLFCPCNCYNFHLLAVKCTVNVHIWGVNYVKSWIHCLFESLNKTYRSGSVWLGKRNRTCRLCKRTIQLKNSRTSAICRSIE